MADRQGKGHAALWKDVALKTNNIARMMLAHGLNAQGPLELNAIEGKLLPNPRA